MCFWIEHLNVGFVVDDNVVVVNDDDDDGVVGVDGDVLTARG